MNALKYFQLFLLIREALADGKLTKQELLDIFDALGGE